MFGSCEIRWGEGDGMDEILKLIMKGVPWFSHLFIFILSSFFFLCHFHRSFLQPMEDTSVPEIWGFQIIDIYGDHD